jgi:hypothetical protein
MPNRNADAGDMLEFADREDRRRVLAILDLSERLLLVDRADRGAKNGFTSIGEVVLVLMGDNSVPLRGVLASSETGEATVVPDVREAT